MKYRVDVVSNITVEVEADTEEEAIDKAIHEANNSMEIWHNYEFDGYISMRKKRGGER